MSAALNADPCRHCKLLAQLETYLATPCTCGGAKTRGVVDDHEVARKLVGFRIGHEKTLEAPPADIDVEFLRGRIDGLQTAIALLRGHGVVVDDPMPPKKRAPKTKPDHLAVVPTHFTPLPSPAAAPGKLPAGARRMLETLERMYPEALTRAQLSTLSLVADGGTLASYLTKLRDADSIVDLADGRIAARKGSAKKPPTTDELVEIWARHLPGKARAMFHALVKLYPQAISRDDLRAAVGGFSNGGTFSTYLSKLTRNRLAEETPDKQIHAGSALFLSRKKGRRS